jgi:uroporphyrinogen decarboxylase
MNSRQRVIAAMKRKGPDRVPYDFTFGFTQPAFDEFVRRTGCSDPGDYFELDTRTVFTGPGQSHIDYSRYHTSTPVNAFIDEWGIGHIPTVSTDVHHSHLSGFVYPLAGSWSVADIAEYPLPDICAPYRHAELPAEVSRLHQKGLAVCGGLECTIFEIAWYMRSMEQLLMDFIDNPEPAEILLDRIVDLRLAQTRQLVSTGIDVLRLGDDVASQRGMIMSVTTWRRWLKPRLAKVIEAARKVNPDILIYYHSDGNVTAAVPELIEIGVDILNPIQPECMDLSSLKKQFGNDLSFWGSIGTQTTMPFGSVKDVRDEVRRHIDDAGAGGGLLLCPTHTIEPEVPWENIVGFVDASKELGAYTS